MIIGRLIRWALILFILCVVLGVAGLLLLNTIVKQMMEVRLHDTTGMEVHIGHVDVGLLTPTVTVDNFKLYNTPDFGGTPFLDMPELHVEYDPSALRSGKLHFRLVRLNLQLVSLVQDKKGRMNVSTFNKADATTNAPAHGHGYHPDLDFTGIDTFVLTLGRLSMSNQGNGTEQDLDFGIKNQISHNVKSEADLAGLNLLLLARSGGFSSGTNSPIDFVSLLKTLTVP